MVCRIPLGEDGTERPGLIRDPDCYRPHVPRTAVRLFGPRARPANRGRQSSRGICPTGHLTPPRQRRCVPLPAQPVRSGGVTRGRCAGSLAATLDIDRENQNVLGVCPYSHIGECSGESTWSDGYTAEVGNLLSRMESVVTTCRAMSRNSSCPVLNLRTTAAMKCVHHL